MKIKKFTATTEKDAIEKVKAELGLDALVLNIKTTKPKGLFAFFRKPVVEVTAAYEEKVANKPLPLASKNTEEPAGLADLPVPGTKVLPDAETQNPRAIESVIKDKTIAMQSIQIESLKNKISSTEDLLSQLMSQLSVAERKDDASGRKYENSMLQIFYEALIDQEVLPEIAEKILEDVNNIEEEDKIDISLIVKVVYNTILNILGTPDECVERKKAKENARVFAFVGPTGVGKTTTIAKLTSIFMLDKCIRIGLITADTYRIAAVEQLKTYGEILGIGVVPIYNNDELKPAINKIKKINDAILIDTAGRSHKNAANLDELKDLLSRADNVEVYLVISVTTKFEDLINIVQSYASVCDFKIIFTKLDETNCLGSILNICYLTGKKVSYITTGQNVPDDIELIEPEKMAKSLLGLNGGAFK